MGTDSDIKNSDPIIQKILNGDRRTLAQAITLVESSKKEHYLQAEKILNSLISYGRQPFLRLAVTGAPGVGKSTFIETFGLDLIEEGFSVAVLAIDPSSPLRGGSILGDKTRMTKLAVHPKAFIRPSPSGLDVSGIAQHTREVMLLCEAAGFDIIIIETVGVGQSQTLVSEIVDMFLLLLSPGGGDELQGIKRGIVEIADLLIINKADDDLRRLAEITAKEYQQALKLLIPVKKDWTPDILICSALQHFGFKEIWGKIKQFQKIMKDNGMLQATRFKQKKKWLKQELNQQILNFIHNDNVIKQSFNEYEQAIINNQLTPPNAARLILQKFFERMNN
ncbi:MAG: methylmalonyl Co-A mutase-associated GTPase MeaB [Alphaproteobacteria bacterium]|nr:methylmalonyl Co-A mutase-associated GTPase MeaB [Alphaproteobacteria bacterium]